MSDWDLGRYKYQPDHALCLVGYDCGYPMMELVCLHGAEKLDFYRDSETGKTYTECLVMEWVNGVGISDIVDSSTHLTTTGRVLLWTITPAYLDGGVQLTGYEGYLDWREAEGMET